MLRLLSLRLPRAGGVEGMHQRTAQGVLLDLTATFGDLGRSCPLQPSAGGARRYWLLQRCVPYM